MDYKTRKGDRSGGVGCSVCAVSEIVSVVIHKEKCRRMIVKILGVKSGYFFATFFCSRLYIR